MAEQAPESANEPDVVTHHTASTASRVVSALIAATAGGLVGYFVGSRGDSNDRKMAQRSFAAVGALFGALLSYFATKNQDIRSYDMTGAPRVLRRAHALPETQQLPAPAPSNQPQTDVQTVEAEHRGIVEMAMTQAASR